MDMSGVRTAHNSDAVDNDDYPLMANLDLSVAFNIVNVKLLQICNIYNI